jgi:hypothetical protein
LIRTSTGSGENQSSGRPPTARVCHRNEWRRRDRREGARPEHSTQAGQRCTDEFRAQSPHALKALLARGQIPSPTPAWLREHALRRIYTRLRRRESEWIIELPQGHIFRGELAPD